MPAPEQSTVRNRLLSLMSADDFARLAPHLEFAKLARGYHIAEPDQPITTVCFPESGIISIVAISPEGQEVEAGIIGRDGFGPTALLMGSDRTLHRLSVQVPDDSFVIDPQPFLEAVEASAGLRGLLLRYVQKLTTQTSYTALSNAVHPIDERLARWILMCDDRNDGRDLALTQEFISTMLAVRRPSVTTSLHVLEGNGFIRSERGCIIIRNRTGLEQFAGDAYGKPEAEYRRLIGPMREDLAGNGGGGVAASAGGGGRTDNGSPRHGPIASRTRRPRNP